MNHLTRLVLIATVLLATYCAALITVMVPWGWAAVGIVGVALFAKRKAFSGYAYGTAHWADEEDARRAGMFEGEGVILGHMAPSEARVPEFKPLIDPSVSSADACRRFLEPLKRKKTPELVRLSKAVHVACFSPTGGGKGVSIVLTHLLTCNDSMVCVDFKGENYKLTADARRRMGHRIVRLDPFGVCGPGSDTFSPFDFIQDNPQAIDDVRELASSLVVRTGEEREPQWNDSAEIWIASMAACVVKFGGAENSSLQSLRTLLTNPAAMQESIKAMIASDAWSGMLQRMGHALTRYVDRELGSVMTTVNRHLTFLDTVTVAENTKASTFDPADLVKKKMTVYLIIPPQYMKTNTPLLRMWIGAMLKAVVKGGLQEKRKVRFVLDEAASLGRMDVIDSAIDKMRGYGVRLLFLYQSVGQLKQCFGEGKDQVLLSNVAQVFFGVNDLDTGKMVAERLGKETIVVASGGSGTSATWQSNSGQFSQNTSHSTSDNWAQSARELLQPDEVMNLPERIAVTFTQGCPPVWTNLVRYYEKGWMPKEGGAFWRAARYFFNALCLFLAALLCAVALTMALGDKQSRQGVPAEPFQFRP